MIQLTVYGDVPLLSGRELADLVAPLGVPQDHRLQQLLSVSVEAAARNLTMYFTERDPDTARQYSTEYRGELAKLAADPARELGEAPASRGAVGARDMVLQAAQMKGLDPETRVGAAAIGNLAEVLLDRDKPSRVGAELTMGVAQVFDDLSECLRVVGPGTLDALPGNELGGERHPAIRFAESFIQLVVDRARPRLPGQTARVRAQLDALLNRSDRALLAGIRRERQFHREHGDWFEGDTGAGDLVSAGSKSPA